METRRRRKDAEDQAKRNMAIAQDAKAPIGQTAATDADESS